MIAFCSLLPKYDLKLLSSMCLHQKVLHWDFCKTKKNKPFMTEIFFANKKAFCLLNNNDLWSQKIQSMKVFLEINASEK